MSSNYSIIVDKGERHEYCVRNIYRALLPGPNSTFNHFIEKSKGYCDTVTESLEEYLNHSSTEKYNNMVSEK